MWHKSVSAIISGHLYSLPDESPFFSTTFPLLSSSVSIASLKRSCLHFVYTCQPVVSMLVTLKQAFFFQQFFRTSKVLLMLKILKLKCCLCRAAKFILCTGKGSLPHMLEQVLPAWNQCPCRDRKWYIASHFLGVHF